MARLTIIYYVQSVSGRMLNVSTFGGSASAFIPETPLTVTAMNGAGFIDIPWTGPPPPIGAAITVTVEVEEQSSDDERKRPE